MTASLTSTCACGHGTTRHFWHQVSYTHCKVCLSCGGDVTDRRGCCHRPKRCPCNKPTQEPTPDLYGDVPGPSGDVDTSFCGTQPNPNPTGDETNRGEVVTDMHSVALRAGVFHVVEREAKAAKEAAKAELSELLLAGDTVAGRVGDEILCKASWSKGSARVVVTDEKAFTAWVKEKHPTEIVETVNPAYIKALKQIDGALVDAAGEIAPGIEVQVGDPSLSVRAEKGALELVDKLIADGRVKLGGLKEIAATETISYSLAEVRDGTGWPKGVRFTAHADATVVEGEVVEGSDA